MANQTFGGLLKSLRKQTGKTLRDFCLEHGFDPGNLSRMERGRFAPPASTEILEKYARALNLSPGSDQWIEFFDVAAASRGELPPDLMSDTELLNKLPVLFRTLRGSPVPADKLDELIDLVRKS